MTEARTRILVVEDDRNIVDLIQANLAVRGFDVATCGDAAKAVWTFETESPDLVLLDLNLPNGDGFELCRQLRERSAVGIIVVSARRGEHDKVRALNLGADDYLTKPFGVEELLARIGATLRRSNGRQLVVWTAAGYHPPTATLHRAALVSVPEPGGLMHHYAYRVERLWTAGELAAVLAAAGWMQTVSHLAKAEGGPNDGWPFRLGGFGLTGYGLTGANR